MKHALVNGQLMPATPDAPAIAACPHCGGPVRRRDRQGTCFWRHVQLPLGGCAPTSPEPAATGGELMRPTRRVGDFGVELHLDAPDGPHLKLRCLSAERAGEPSGLIVPLRQARLLAEALLDAVAESAAASPPP